MRAALLVLAACSSAKVEEAKPVRVADAAPADAAASDAAAGDAPMARGLGDAQIRVEWKDVPVAARASPGRTACNSPRAAAVAPTTTWGIPEVVVVVDGAPTDPGEARIVLDDCRLTPRVVAAGALVLASAVDHPVQVGLAKRGEVGKVAAGKARPVRLPIAGHAVTIDLEAGAVYEVSSDGETAWVVAGRAAVTEANGQVIVRDLTAGAHAVTAWLPPRAGQPARLARGTVTVVANELAELTLQLVP